MCILVSSWAWSPLSLPYPKSHTLNYRGGQTPLIVDPMSEAGPFLLYLSVLMFENKFL